MRKFIGIVFSVLTLPLILPAAIVLTVFGYTVLPPGYKLPTTKVEPPAIAHLWDTDAINKIMEAYHEQADFFRSESDENWEARKLKERGVVRV